MNPIKSLLLCAVLALGLSAKAQIDTNTLPASIGDAVTNVFHFLGQGSNFMPAVGGTISTDGKKFGGWVALAYKVNDFVAPVMRFDYWDGRLFTPSLSVQLQLPISIGPKAKLYPLLYSGMATPLAGREDEDPLIGIFGVGAALRISSHLDVLGAYERWTSVSDQIRIGFLWRPVGW